MARAPQPRGAGKWVTWNGKRHFLKLGPEESVQQALIEWCRYRGKPYDRIFHVLNGGHVRAQAGKNAWAMMKQRFLGVRPGVLDLYLLVPRAPFHGLVLEAKAPGGRASPEQKQEIAELRELHYDVHLFTDWQEGANLMARYLGDPLPFRETLNRSRPSRL